MTAFGSLLAVLAGLLHDLAQLAVSPSALTGATATTAMTALAATVLAGAMLAAGLALLTSVAGTSAPPPCRCSAAPGRCGRSPGGRRSCGSATLTRRAGPGPEHRRRP